MNRKQQWTLVDMWQAEAKKHEEAMAEYSDEDELDEEYFIHEAISQTFHRCIRELLVMGRHLEEEIQF